MEGWAEALSWKRETRRRITATSTIKMNASSTTEAQTRQARVATEATTTIAIVAATTAIVSEGTKTTTMTAAMEVVVRGTTETTTTTEIAATNTGEKAADIAIGIQVTKAKETITSTNLTRSSTKTR